MDINQLFPSAVKRAWRRIRIRFEKAAAPRINADSLRAAASQHSKYIVRTLTGVRDAQHGGNDTDFYLRKGFNVVAVEANPILAAAAEQRFKTTLREGR